MTNLKSSKQGWNIINFAFRNWTKWNKTWSRKICLKLSSYSERKEDDLNQTIEVEIQREKKETFRSHFGSNWYDCTWRVEEARVMTDFEISILMNGGAITWDGKWQRSLFGGKVMNFVLNLLNVTCLKTLGWRFPEWV